MPDEVPQTKRIKHTIGLKADLGDSEEEFDCKEGYQQQGPRSSSPATITRSAWFFWKFKGISGRQTSPQLAARCLEPQLQEEQKDNKQEEEQQEDEKDNQQPVTAVPEAISTTVLTTLTTPGPKRLYNKSQAQLPQATPTDILQAMHKSLIQQQEAREQEQIDRQAALGRDCCFRKGTDQLAGGFSIVAD